MWNALIRLVSLSLLVLIASCDDDDPTGPGGGGGLNLTNFQEAAVIIGQPDEFSSAANSGATTNASGLDSPVGAGAGALYIPDQRNHRVLGFGGIPTGDGAPASFVIGQPDFGSNTEGTSAQKFSFPVDCAVYGGKLFLCDYGNNRVLIWNALPSSDVPANVVVGQETFTGSAIGTTQYSLAHPIRVAVGGGKLFVADWGNNRVLIWNTIPTANLAFADVVVGQTDFTTGTTGLTAATFGSPYALWTDGRRLAIGDASNDRVLIWSSIPTSNGVAADVVVGAADFTTEGSNTPSATSIGKPFGLASDGTTLFVSDANFHRVLGFKPFPTANGASASLVLGQGSFTNSASNDADQDGISDATPTARTMSGPLGITIIGSRLLVADGDNHRVLVFKSQ